MTQLEVLVAAIRADPADDLVRFAYADLIEEMGDAKYASYVRWQIANAAGDSFGQTPRVSWRKWFDPPWTGYTTAYHNHSHGGLDMVRWMTGERETRIMTVYRGLVESATLPLDVWLARGAALAARWPIAAAGVSDKEPLGGLSVFQWRCNSGMAPSVHNLPRVVMDLVCADRRATPSSNNYRATFRSAVDANAALSDAVLFLARRPVETAASPAAQSAG